MAAPVAVVVRHALPGDNRREAPWSPRGDAPLRAGVVGYPQQADLARRPGLVGRPLDDIEKTLAGARAHGIQQPRALPQPALISPNNRVSRGGPEDGVGGLPSGVVGAVVRVDLGKGAGEEGGVGDVFSVGAVGDEDGPLGGRVRGDWEVDVGADGQRRGLEGDGDVFMEDEVVFGVGEGLVDVPDGGGLDVCHGGGFLK